MERMPDNGRFIYLPDEQTKLARVVRREDGFTVREQAIRVDELFLAFTGMMEPSDLKRVLMQSSDVVSEVVKPALENLNGENLAKVLSTIVGQAEGTDSMPLIVSLYKSVASKFDLSKLDPTSFAGFLNYVLQRVTELEDDKALADLFLVLLSKVKIASTRNSEMIRSVIGVMSNIQDAEVKQFFREAISEFSPVVKTACTPILPKGTVLYQEESNGTKIIILERDKAQRNVQFHDSVYEQVGHPKLLFAFAVRGKHIRGCRIFAVKDAVIKPATELYRYPFANVYKEDQRACWPELSGIEINNLFELQNLPELFFNSPANNHLFQGENLREWLMKLQGKDFEDKQLSSLKMSVMDCFEMFKSAAEASVDNRVEAPQQAAAV
ncbi:hypothetical protein [Paenibacillus abyssi]|uniref:Uncharacterized protein n=1 Tax=Paenibacillus abyssi TaxID=1340531 RepID=A0A917LFI2_9BACL|nr:hypothetical protein [Paenibacillus abyssi]GGG18306.1 hypothetical protein GCM10010916_38940 [Paenibacillus abyssi]